jgi:endonuclease YncB( thermonuclease family)
MAFDGIDTPETNSARGIEFRDYLRSRLPDNVQITVSPIETDRYGRTVAEIFLGESFINAEMVREGHAWHYQRYSGNCLNRSAIDGDAAGGSFVPEVVSGRTENERSLFCSEWAGGTIQE